MKQMQIRDEWEPISLQYIFHLEVLLSKVLVPWSFDWWRSESQTPMWSMCFT